MNICVFFKIDRRQNPRLVPNQRNGECDMDEVK